MEGAAAADAGKAGIGGEIQDPLVESRPRSAGGRGRRGSFARWGVIG
jgi:hypothetical protein